jgi:hypothetical protein
MIGIQCEFLSKHRCLLGIFFQNGSEMLEGKRMEFDEIAIGLIFIYFRVAKYKEYKEVEE